MEGEVEEGEEVDSNELLEALKSNENISIEILHEEPPKESNTVSGKAISLISISADDDINKDKIKIRVWFWKNFFFDYSNPQITNYSSLPPNNY